MEEDNNSIKEEKQLKVKKVFDKPTEVIEEEETKVVKESNPKEAQD